MDDVIEVMIQAMAGNGFPGAKRSDVIAALRAAEQAGWRLVPVEPTDEMVQAYFKRDPLDIELADPESDWGALIQAAPRPWDEVER